MANDSITQSHTVEMSRPTIVHNDCTISAAIEELSLSHSAEAMIVDKAGSFIASLQIEQLRTALNSGLCLSDSVRRVAEQFSRDSQTITARVSDPASTRNSLLLRHALESLPVVNDKGQIVGIHTRPRKNQPARLPAVGVLMAGGFGKRLGKLTANTPKPMLQIGGQSLLERTLIVLRDAGVEDFYISVFYRSEQIINHFGDGKKFGVRIEYLREDTPLGTAGALSLINEVNEPVIMINGDILTELDFRAMHEFHTNSSADLTVGLRNYHYDVPYGVVESQAGRIVSLAEKPRYEYWVNAGIYVISPEAVSRIPSGEVFQMTDLIDSLMTTSGFVASFPIIEYWLDIGNVQDFERAQQDITGLRRAAA